MMNNLNKIKMGEMEEKRTGTKKVIITRIMPHKTRFRRTIIFQLLKNAKRKFKSNVKKLNKIPTNEKQ